MSVWGVWLQVLCTVEYLQASPCPKKRRIIMSTLPHAPLCLHISPHSHSLHHLSCFPTRRNSLAHSTHTTHTSHFSWVGRTDVAPTEAAHAKQLILSLPEMMHVKKKVRARLCDVFTSSLSLCVCMCASLHPKYCLHALTSFWVVYLIATDT